ncbi:transcriptional regulator [Gordonia spumicola]|uniref:Transcriptional regulator n=1 Tax=Gordonia spumicola TaxID=589161 RepID=A0A7I9V7J0_9ACTN|nr:hypothetical protein [Gordonia spumicola]GEE01309.1 transcriptional regulator [Gordonia spumicola]
MTDATGRPRDRVRELLATSDTELDAHEVGRALDIHATTARFHLNNLVTEGAAITVQLPPEGVGRPRLAYTIAPPPAADELDRLLLMQLGPTPEAREAAAATAGRQWARLHAAPAPQAALPDPVIAVETTLTRLGFRITDVLSEFGRHRITLCSCPLKHLASRAPEVARGAVRGAVDEALAAGALDDAYDAVVHPDPDGDCTLILVLSGAEQLTLDEMLATVTPPD